jgi:hypothetical protein
MQGQCGSSRKKAKKGGCDGTCMGGSRRKTRGRRMRGGAGYGAGSALAVGALEYKPAYTGPVDPTGKEVPDPTDPRGGYTGIGGRRRKTRKGRKATRKGRKGTRKMRGGSASMGAMKANAGVLGRGRAGSGHLLGCQRPWPWDECILTRTSASAHT